MATCISSSRRSSTWARVAGGLAVVALLGACGDDDEDPDAVSDDQVTEPATDDAASEDAAVTASGFEFTTGPVAAGAEVTFRNDDDVPHTATADDESFDSGQVGPGESASLTAPDEPGDYDFHCEIHPDMQASLTVE